MTNNIINRNEFTRAVYVAANTVEKRYTFPILENIKLQEVNGDFQITGTDLDIEISVTIPANAIETGFEITMPCHQLHRLLSKSRKSDCVSFEINKAGNIIEINNGKTKFNLNTIPAIEYPYLKCKPFTSSFELNGSLFYNAINAVQGAMSNEETRYYLNGIYMQEFQGCLRFVATDGHRIYCQDLTLPVVSLPLPNVIIPRKVIAIIQKIIKPAFYRPKTVKISVSQTRFKIEFDNVCIIAKVINGTFPDYNRLISTDFKSTMEVAAKDFSDAIKDVSLIAKNKKGIKLSIKGETLGLSVRDSDLSIAESSIPMIMTGEDLEIGFNSKYLIELLAVEGLGKVKLELNSPRSPTRIIGDLAGWQAVLMPLRI